MRTRRIETVAALLALTLVGVAVAVAALRSRPVEPGSAAAASPAAEAEPARGAELYGAECAMCHRPSRPIDGAGRYAEPAGREALIDLLLAGAIDGEPGAHPDSAHLADADVATLAAHLVDLWNGAATPAFSADEVAARRP